MDPVDNQIHSVNIVGFSVVFETLSTIKRHKETVIDNYEIQR